MERAHIIQAVSEALAAIPDVEAAWLEGSEAFGRTDELSDIDIIAVVDDPAVERVLSAVEQCLDRLGGIAVAFRQPTHESQGLPECYYRLAGTPEHLVIDLALVRPKEVASALDPVRHGVPHILFDRESASQANATIDKRADAYFIAAHECTQRVVTRYQIGSPWGPF